MPTAQKIRKLQSEKEIEIFQFFLNIFDLNICCVLISFYHLYTQFKITLYAELWAFNTENLCLGSLGNYFIIFPLLVNLS